MTGRSKKTFTILTVLSFLFFLIFSCLFFSSKTNAQTLPNPKTQTNSNILTAPNTQNAPPPQILQETFLIRQVTSDRAGTSILISGSGSGYSQADFSINTIKVANPYRIAIDINNAVLVGTKRNINIKSASITDAKIAQFSTEPNIVRLVVTVDSLETLKKINAKKTKNSILIDLQEIIPLNIYEKPLYQQKKPVPRISAPSGASDLSPITIDLNRGSSDYSQSNISSEIFLKNAILLDNRFIITGAGIMSVSEPVILVNPGRFVFDIYGGIVDSADMLLPKTLKNGDIVRIGQFGTSTARIVIESKNPQMYKSILSPDMQSVLIVPAKELNFNEMPDSYASGTIQSIKTVKPDKKSTIITILATKPIIHSIKHTTSPSKLAIEMFNIGKPANISSATTATPIKIGGFTVENIDRFPKGTRLVMPLNKTTRSESRLSLDGRVMEILLVDESLENLEKLDKLDKSPQTIRASENPTNKQPTINPRNSKWKVVIDPGHGGADPGAARAGVYEKNITLDIAKRVGFFLRSQDISIVMTRDEDRTLPLKEIVEITNYEMPDAFVSIHVNSSENSGVTGLETYYYTPQSLSLAQSVHSRMASKINSPDRKIRTARFYVIRNTEVPAILAEIGYISNEWERNAILSEERKNTTAKAIAEGIINFLKSN